MMMADRVDIWPRLEDLAVNDALAIGQDVARCHLLGIEGELEHVRWLDQLGAARAREQVVTGIFRMTHAHMAEAVEHALVGNNAVGNRKRVAGVFDGVGHVWSFVLIVARMSVSDIRDSGATRPRCPAFRCAQCGLLRVWLSALACTEYRTGARRPSVSSPH